MSFVQQDDDSALSNHMSFRVAGSPQPSTEYGIMDTFYARLNSLKFTTAQTAITTCRDLAREYGFTVKQETSANKNVYLYCSREGLSDSRKGRKQIKRKRSSLRCDCKWRIILFQNENCLWTFRKSQNPQSLEHNHELSLPDHMPQPWPPQVIERIAYHASTGLQTKEIRVVIQNEFPNLLWDERRFYNRLSEERRKIKARDTEIRVLNTMALAARTAALVCSNKGHTEKLHNALDTVFRDVCQSEKVDPDVFLGFNTFPIQDQRASIASASLSSLESVYSPPDSSSNLDFACSYPGGTIIVKNIPGQRGRPSKNQRRNNSPTRLERIRNLERPNFENFALSPIVEHAVHQKLLETEAAGTFEHEDNGPRSTANLDDSKHLIRNSDDNTNVCMFKSPPDLVKFKRNQISAIPPAYPSPTVANPVDTLSRQRTTQPSFISGPAIFGVAPNFEGQGMVHYQQINRTEQQLSGNNLAIVQSTENRSLVFGENTSMTQAQKYKGPLVENLAIDGSHPAREGSVTDEGGQFNPCSSDDDQGSSFGCGPIQPSGTTNQGCSSTFTDDATSSEERSLCDGTSLMSSHSNELTSVNGTRVAALQSSPSVSGGFMSHRNDDPCLNGSTPSNSSEFCNDASPIQNCVNSTVNGPPQLTSQQNEKNLSSTGASLDGTQSWNNSSTFHRIQTSPLADDPSLGGISGGNPVQLLPSDPSRWTFGMPPRVVQHQSTVVTNVAPINFSTNPQASPHVQFYHVQSQHTWFHGH